MRERARKVKGNVAIKNFLKFKRKKNRIYILRERERNQEISIYMSNMERILMCC